MNNDIELNNGYLCNYCNKKFKYYQNRWDHEKNHCKIRKNKEKICQQISNVEENKVDKLRIELLEKENEILKLKLKIQSAKSSKLTINQLNKLLLERQNTINNMTNGNNNNINIINNNNQIINNNFNLVGFNKEEILEKLSYQDKKMIINAKYGCLEKFIELVHCGTYNQFKNIIITNMKDNYMYKYDDTKNQFVLSSKTDVLNTLVDSRVYELEVIYNELLEKNKINEQTKKIIENFINTINYDDNKFTDLNGQLHPTYKQYKINEIKLLLFNNQDKMLNDISLLLTTTNE